MSFKKIVSAAILAVACTGLSAGPASAQWQGLNYMVSPVGCFPKDAESASKLELVNGAWAMRAGRIGFAHVLCPINISGDGSAKIKFAQLWFRVPGNAQDYMKVNVEVMARHRGFPGAHLVFRFGSQWDWNFGGDWLHNDYGYANLQGEWIDMPRFGFNYFADVVLWRNQDTYDIAFTGLELRFKDPLNPERDPAPDGDPGPDPVDSQGAPGGLAFP